MPIYIYKGNSQISTNAVRNDKAVKAIYAKEQGKDVVCVWGRIPYEQMFTYSITDNKVKITGLKPEVQTAYITIPNIISDKQVDSIADSAFKNKTNIVNLMVSDNVTRIGSGAFSGCSSLESITIPFVGARAGVTSSDTYQYPFGYMFGISSYIGGTPTKQNYHGSSTISGTYTTYYIPSSLKSVTVTGGNILYGAFSGCTGLTSVTIGGGVTSIGTAFEDCTRLTTVNWNATECTSAGSSNTAPIFSTCPNLATVNIGDNVKIIPSDAFKDCRGLTSITIPDSVMSIGGFVFSGCTGLTSVTIGGGVTSIGTYAFEDCTRLTSITFNGTIEQWNAISKGWYWNSNTGNYTIHCTDGDIPK